MRTTLFIINLKFRPAAKPPFNVDDGDLGHRIRKCFFSTLKGACANSTPQHGRARPNFKLIMNGLGRNLTPVLAQLPRTSIRVDLFRRCAGRCARHCPQSTAQTLSRILGDDANFWWPQGARHCGTSFRLPFRTQAHRDCTSEAVVLEKCHRPCFKIACRRVPERRCIGISEGTGQATAG